MRIAQSVCSGPAVMFVQVEIKLRRAHERVAQALRLAFREPRGG